MTGLHHRLRAVTRRAPQFISASTAHSASNTVTVTAPTGIRNGDLLVFVGVIATTGQRIDTYPSGFLQIARTSSNNCLHVAYKIANAESGNYSFVWSDATDKTGTILVYRDATEVNTVGAISGTSIAGGVTPTYTGTLVAVYGNKNLVSITTAPSGMTQRSNYSSAPSLVCFDLASQAASATGDKTISWTANTREAVLLQVTNEPEAAPEFIASAYTQNSTQATTLVIDKPAGTLEGDIMVALACGAGVSNVTWTGADTGWTEIVDQNSPPNLRLAYKVAGASEGSSYTFTASASRTYQGCILTYRYGSYGTIAGTLTTGADPLELTSITTTASQTILIAVGVRGATSITLGTPPGMTARVTDNNATGDSFIVCDQIVPKGPTTDKAMSTGSSSTVSGIMMSVSPTRSI